MPSRFDGKREASLAAEGLVRYANTENRSFPELWMTYVVTDNCIKCKYTDCVEVCPVDCFYEGDNMLVIHPDECIDCGVCEPECPADAIKPDTVPGLMASAGHSGSQTPQSMHSS
eukprot:gene6172-8351_t